jgi:hypothetical protein
MNDLERYGNACDGWLIDTNIISATIGNRPLESVPDERLRLSEFNDR